MLKLKRAKYTKEKIEEVVAKSDSYSDVIRGLGLKVSGGNFVNIKAMIMMFKIKTSHFTGLKYLSKKRRNLKSYRRISDKDFFSNNSSRRAGMSIKKRLDSLGLLKNQCSICGIDSWMDKKLILQVDHINGKNYDNRIKNLRLLCPNCHSQTSTWCARNCVRNKSSIKRKNYKRNRLPGIVCNNEKENGDIVLVGDVYHIKRKKCMLCSNPIKNRTGKYCSVICRKEGNKKIDWRKVDLKKYIKDKTPFTTIAKEIGVSDVAVRKMAKKLKLI